MTEVLRTTLIDDDKEVRVDVEYLPGLDICTIEIRTDSGVQVYKADWTERLSPLFCRALELWGGGETR